MSTGRNIAILRKKRGITQKELAKKVGITREYLALIETNKENISQRLLAQIAYVLCTTINELTKEG